MAQETRMTDDDLDWSNYDSGPFCRHWSESSDCEICRAGCATCGHSGLDHDYGGEGPCDECDCKKWIDKE